MEKNEKILRAQFYGDEWSELMKNLNTDITPSVLKAMELYANQFREEKKWIETPIDTKLIPEGFLLAFGLNEYSRERRIRARYVQPLTETGDVELNDENMDYSEEQDEYFIKEGWYESNDCEEINWRVTYPITHYMPLPSPPNKEG